MNMQQITATSTGALIATGIGGYVSLKPWNADVSICATDGLTDTTKRVTIRWNYGDYFKLYLKDGEQLYAFGTAPVHVFYHNVEENGSSSSPAPLSFTGTIQLDQN